MSVLYTAHTSGVLKATHSICVQYTLLITCIVLNDVPQYFSVSREAALYFFTSTFHNSSPKF